jgi:hypothetical protein
MEMEAVRHIFHLIEVRRVQWIASTVLEAEIFNDPDIRRRTDALNILRFAVEIVAPDSRIAARAGFFHAMGYGRFDALHLALGKASNVDALLTTDDRFLRQAHRGLGSPSIRAAIPLDWLKRVIP